jgi:hypothetical protein
MGKCRARMVNPWMPHRKPVTWLQQALNCGGAIIQQVLLHRTQGEKNVFCWSPISCFCVVPTVTGSVLQLSVRGLEVWMRHASASCLLSAIDFASCRQRALDFCSCKQIVGRSRTRRFASLLFFCVELVGGVHSQRIALLL